MEPKADLHTLQRELEHLRGRFQALAENSYDLICELDGQCRFAYASPTYRQILGFEPDELLGQSFWDFVHPDDRENVQKRLQQCYQRQSSLRFTFRQKRHQNPFLWVEATGKTFHASETSRAVLVCRDATEQKQREDRLDFLANHDLLTGLSNRNALYSILSRYIEHARQGFPSTLLFLDLDHLKIVNDTIGHTAGDYLIEAVAGILQRLISPEDALVRFAGDEFIMIFNDTSLTEGLARAKAICKTIGSQRFTRSGQSFQLHASIGLTLIDGQTKGEEIISKADVACYSAKNLGGDRAEIFQETNTQIQKLRNESEVFNRLKHALETGRAALWYQPIVDLQTRGTISYEALLRIQDEGGTWRTPAAFLSAAERFRGMDHVDAHVIELAMMDLKQNPDLELSINLSGQSIGHEEIHESLLAGLKEHGIDPCRLTVEITETAFISNLSQAIEFVKDLQQIGIQFALDDFGSGFSSLAYLRDIPVNIVKIDGSFIRTLAQETINQTLVRAINEVAHLLNKKTVAEFVCDEPTLTMATQLGIDYGQGFHLDKPRPLGEITL